MTNTPQPQGPCNGWCGERYTHYHNTGEQPQGAPQPLVGSPKEWALWLETIVECSEEAPPDGDRYLWPEDRDGLLETAKWIRALQRQRDALRELCEHEGHADLPSPDACIFAYRVKRILDSQEQRGEQK